MNKQIADALVSLLLRLFRTIAFLMVGLALVGRAPQDRTIPTAGPQPTLRRVTPAEAGETQRPAAYAGQAVVRNIGPAG